jgi:hypothetical protein
MIPRDEVVRPGGDGAPPARPAAWQVVRAAAVASAAAFAGGGLLTQTVIVPYWQAMEPAAFLTSFETYGPETGATLFPLELLAIVLLGLVVYSTVRSGEPGRLVWIGALLCMVATVLLLPLYFAGANDRFVSRTIAENDVAATLRSWYAWNWARTGLAFLAVILGSTGLGYRANNRD